jgi:hypothetical protein
LEKTVPLTSVPAMSSPRALLRSTPQDRLLALLDHADGLPAATVRRLAADRDGTRALQLALVGVARDLVEAFASVDVGQPVWMMVSLANMLRIAEFGPDGVAPPPEMAADLRAAAWDIACLERDATPTIFTVVTQAVYAALPLLMPADPTIVPIAASSTPLQLAYATVERVLAALRAHPDRTVAVAAGSVAPVADRVRAALHRSSRAAPLTTNEFVRICTDALPNIRDLGPAMSLRMLQRP